MTLRNQKVSNLKNAFLFRFSALESQNQIVLYVNINRWSLYSTSGRKGGFLAIMRSDTVGCALLQITIAKLKNIKPDIKVNAQPIPCNHDRKTVTGWFCQCSICAKTVGTCSLIALVI